MLHPAFAGPTPEEYIAHVGGDAKLVAAGELKLDGYKLYCGQRPTVLDSNLDDYGAAYPGFLILNPRLLAKVSLPVKLWIHAHECGHQFRGPDEETADCFAVQRGRRQRWLTPEGLEEVCRQGRQHALFRLAPLRLDAGVLCGSLDPLGALRSPRRAMDGGRRGLSEASLKQPGD